MRRQPVAKAKSHPRSGSAALRREKMLEIVQVNLEI
jgi:hypothetical protein